MIPLYKPYMPDELPELQNILYSGMLAYGKWGRLFEEKLGSFIGEKKVLTLNSYNAAMQVALTAIGINEGDEVIASPMSCLASNQPLVTQGAKVVWADVDPSAGTLNPGEVKTKVTSKTKAILHNHHCGYAGYIDEINKIASDHGLIVIDDAIEAFGTKYKGNYIGNTGSDITVFSFQTVRLPNTIDGGGLAFKNGQLFEKAMLIRDLGVDRTKFRDKNGEISSQCDITLPGFGVTSNEVNSYIGVQQLIKIEELLNKQQENARLWSQFFQNNYPNCKMVGKTIPQQPNYWVFGVLSSEKEALIQQFRNKGFYASGVHLPNNNYSVFKNSENLPGVNDFYSKFLALPCGWWVNDINNVQG